MKGNILTTSFAQRLKIFAMPVSIYQVNKGINKSIEFKGIKGQYIMYMGAGLVALLLIFSICYIIGVHLYILLAVVGTLGYALMSWVFRYSHKYGEHGLLKEAGYRQLPVSIKCFSRQTFLHLDPENPAP